MTVIERLGPRQTERLKRIRLAALQDAPDAFATTYAQAAALSDFAWRDQLDALPTFIAVLDGRDQGMARCAPDTEHPDTASLISVWVAPAARMRGVGGALVDAAVAWARKAGFDSLVLDVGRENASARALYDRKGFRPTGETSTLPPPREHILEDRLILALR